LNIVTSIDWNKADWRPLLGVILTLGLSDWKKLLRKFLELGGGNIEIGIT